MAGMLLVELASTGHGRISLHQLFTDRADVTGQLARQRQLTRGGPTALVLLMLVTALCQVGEQFVVCLHGPAPEPVVGVAYDDGIVDEGGYLVVFQSQLQRANDVVFEILGLVNDDHISGLDDLAVQDYVEGQQRVIEDDDVRLLRLDARQLIVALAQHRAALTQTIVLAYGERVPQLAEQAQFFDVPRWKLLQSLPQLTAGDPALSRAEGSLAREDQLLAQFFQFDPTDVVSPSLEQSRRERPGGDAPQGRDVLLPELVLKRLVGRGDECPLAGPDERDEVGERFAAAGAGFNERVLPPIQSAFDQSRHQRLASPGAVSIAQEVGHRASGRKDEGDVLFFPLGLGAWCSGSR